MSSNGQPGSRGSGGFSTSAGPRFGPLVQLFENIFWTWGTVRFAPGMYFPRNMVIVRQGSELTVVHPVLMPPAQQAAVEALGTIRHIVRLGAFHGMDDPAYVERYHPKVWAPPGVDLRPGVVVDEALVPSGVTPISGAAVVSFTRSLTPELVLHVPQEGGVLLACDSIQNWESTEGCSLLAKLLAAPMGFKGRPCLGPGWRKMSEPKDGIGFRPTFEQLLGLEFRHAIGAHGPPMKDSAKSDLQAAVRRLYG